jgi:hypothetical protein
MTTHIRLELRPDGDTFAGRATSDMASREFHGWLGLIGAIEALAQTSGPATADEEEPARR